MKIKLFVLLLLLGNFAVAKAQAEIPCSVLAYHESAETSTGLNIRSGAGTNFEVVKNLPFITENYYIFEIIGTKDGWFRIKSVQNRLNQNVFRGDGWVFGQFLTVDTPASETKVFKAYYSPEANSGVKENLKNYKAYELKSCSGDWVQIGSARDEPKRVVNAWLPKGSYCGNYDYCNADANIFAPENTKEDSDSEDFAGENQKETACEIAAFVADPSSGVNVRSGAGANNSVITTIPKDAGGTLIFIDGAKGDWLKISSAVNSKKTRVFSGTGWVHAPLFFVKTSSKNNALVNYYRTPNLRSEKLGSIRSELEVSLMGCSGDWVKVLIPMRGTEGIEGWLARGSWCGSPWEDCM
jgi:uncharacterized protein YraI